MEYQSTLFRLYPVRDLLANIMPGNRDVTHIDPSITAIILYFATLPEASDYFHAVCGDKAPLYLVADEQDEAKCMELGKKYNVKALPLRSRHTILQKQYCLYATPKWNIWDQDGLETLASLCAKEGITSGYQIAAATLAPLPVRKPSPEHIDRRMDDVARIYNALADETSKDVFLRFIKSLQTGDSSYLPFSSYPQYRHPAAMPRPGDIVIDGGAFDGASALSFSKLVGEKGRVIAFEPLSASTGAAKKLVSGKANILVEPYALWSERGDFRIANAGSGSTLSSDGAGEPVRAISLDEYFAEHPSRCDCIKLDIEGAEPEALVGAERTIQAHRPKLYVCLYHKQAHYLDIPLYILRNWPFYDLYMGHHSHTVWESCIYAVPKSS